MEIIKVKRNGISRGQYSFINNFKVVRKKMWENYTLEKNALLYSKLTLMKCQNKIRKFKLDMRELFRKQRLEKFMLCHIPVIYNLPNIKIINAINGECIFEGFMSLFISKYYNEDFCNYNCVIGITLYDWIDFPYYIDWKNPTIYLVKSEIYQDLNYLPIESMLIESYIKYKDKYCIKKCFNSFGWWIPRKKQIKNSIF
jgi:hypothetical protein